MIGGPVKVLSVVRSVIFNSNSKEWVILAKKKKVHHHQMYMDRRENKTGAKKGTSYLGGQTQVTVSDLR